MTETGAWSAATYAAISSPVIAGYTADQPLVSAADAVAGKNVTTTVTYAANTDTTATVTYVDEADGQTVKTETVVGTTDAVKTYDIVAPAGYHVVAVQQPQADTMGAARG